MIGGREKELRKTFEPGERIIRAGDHDHEMYVIERGRVRVTKELDGREIELAILRTGDSFGEMALLESHPRSASVTAVRRTDVRVIKKGTLVLRFRRDPEFALSLLRRLATRVRDTSQKLVRVLSEAPITDEEATRAMEHHDREVP